MYRVLECIRYEHDYRLVLLAVAICALTSWMAWYLYALSSKSSGLSRWAWILQTAVATGSGIWATHFIAMLAFKSALPTTYEPLLTLTSLLIAICVSGAGFCIAEGNRPTWIYLLAGTVEMQIEGAPTLTLQAGDGFLIPPRTPHNATDLGPATGQMLSTYIVEIGQPLATLTG